MVCLRSMYSTNYVVLYTLSTSGMGIYDLLTADEEVHSHTSEDCITAGKRADQAKDASENQQHQAERQQDDNDPVQIYRENGFY